jgi:hypothetical protein
VQFPSNWALCIPALIRTILDGVHAATAITTMRVGCLDHARHCHHLLFYTTNEVFDRGWILGNVLLMGVFAAMFRLLGKVSMQGAARCASTHTPFGSSTYSVGAEHTPPWLQTARTLTGIMIVPQIFRAGAGRLDCP